MNYETIIYIPAQNALSIFGRIFLPFSHALSFPSPHILSELSLWPAWVRGISTTGDDLLSK